MDPRWREKCSRRRSGRRRRGIPRRVAWWEKVGYVHTCFPEDVERHRQRSILRRRQQPCVLTLDKRMNKSEVNQSSVTLRQPAELPSKAHSYRTNDEVGLPRFVPNPNISRREVLKPVQLPP